MLKRCIVTKVVLGVIAGFELPAFAADQGVTTDIGAPELIAVWKDPDFDPPGRQDLPYCEVPSILRAGL
jgi:hypothetical protein